MASSFHLFRRNQKLMLAILTLLAMFAFVFLDPLFKYVGGNPAPADPVVVETKYGGLKASEIQRLVSSRRLVDQFLTMVTGTAVDKMIDQGKLDPRSREMYIRMFSNEWRQRIMTRSSQGNEEAAAVETMLLDKRAEQMHLVVSDAAINQFLKEISLDSVSQREMAGLINKLHGGGVGENQLFDALRNELTAWRVTQSFEVSAAGLTPAQRWDYYQRLNRKATIEAIPVAVADFADQVPDPGDDELKKFFDAHKNTIPVAGSPDAGFKQPRRERFQYFKVDYAMFRDMVEPTEEEIEKYYEANKKTMFRKLALPEAKSDEKKAEDADETKDDEEKPAAEDEKKTEPAEKPAETEKSENAKSAGDAPKPKKTDGGLNDRTRSNGVKFRLVADEKKVEPADAAKEETPQAEPAKDETKKDETAKEESPKADAPATSSEPEYEPLEKVKEQIIGAIKTEKANEKIASVMDELASQLRSYTDARAYYLAKKDSDPQATPPKELDFIALAKKYTASFEETKLVSAADLSSAPGLGKSFMSVQSGMPYQYRSAPFAEVAFGNARPLYSPITTQDSDGNTYLAWKVEQVEEQVPKFADARNEVLLAWKMLKARDLARKQAETYAAEAKRAGKPLSEDFSGDKGPQVVKAGPFSWLTLGSTPEQGRMSVPTISEVTGIENPGEDFMRATFALAVGGVGVGMNNPQTICYVIQPAEFAPPTSELETDFASADFGRYRAAGYTEMRGLYDHWIAEINRESDVKWLREPSLAETD
jgi:hypothetical protein